eukprot:jgi/Picsp_1/4771/NSC_02139-R1_polyphosphoinositide phosphatase fig4
MAMQWYNSFNYDSSLPCSYVEWISVYETEQKIYVTGKVEVRELGVGPGRDEVDDQDVVDARGMEDLTGTHCEGGDPTVLGEKCGSNASSRTGVSGLKGKRNPHVAGDNDAESHGHQETGNVEKWKIMKIERMGMRMGASKNLDEGSEGGWVLDVTEDERLYTKEELEVTLQCLHQGNIATGGLKRLIGPCRALLGVFRWNWCYYMLLATKVNQVGTVRGFPVYGIQGTALVPLAPSYAMKNMPAHIAAKEAECKRLLSLVTLTKDFFFSFCWDTWATVQDVLSGVSERQDAFESDRVWNSNLTKPLRDAIGHGMWTVPLIHGFWEQQKVSVLGQTLDVTLVGRRSSEFAGTRFLRRGVNEDGYVANDVEVEQIVEVYQAGQLNSISSVVQLRGSVPLYWSQVRGFRDTSLNVKPTIKMLQFLDPFMKTTRMHFEKLRNKYGNPILCLNLCRSKAGRGQEELLSSKYAEAIRLLNCSSCPEEKIALHSWDMRAKYQTMGAKVLPALQKFQKPLLKMTGIFVASKRNLKLQIGVVRTNCVDCLDRTNVSQFAFGLLAFGDQLHALGIAPSDELDPRSTMAAVLMRLYEQMGDALAHQYGGSNAHSGFFQRWRGDWSAARQSKDFLTTLKRFYSNTVTDEEKQHAIDLFLGQGSSEQTGFMDSLESFTAQIASPRSYSDVSDSFEAELQQQAPLNASEGPENKTGKSSQDVPDDACSLGSCEDDENEPMSLPRLLSDANTNGTASKSYIQKQAEGSQSPNQQKHRFEQAQQETNQEITWKDRLKRLAGLEKTQNASLVSFDDIIPKNIERVRITAPSPPPVSTFSWLTTPRKAQTERKSSPPRKTQSCLTVRTRFHTEEARSPESRLTGDSPTKWRPGGGHDLHDANPLGLRTASMPIAMGVHDYYHVAGLNLEGADIVQDSLRLVQAPMSARSSKENDALYSRSRASNGRSRRSHGIWSTSSLPSANDHITNVKKMGIQKESAPYWSGETLLTFDPLQESAQSTSNLAIASTLWTPTQYKSLEAMAAQQLHPTIDIVSSCGFDSIPAK